MSEKLMVILLLGLFAAAVIYFWKDRSHSDCHNSIRICFHGKPDVEILRNAAAENNVEILEIREEKNILFLLVENKGELLNYCRLLRMVAELPEVRSVHEEK